MSFRFYTPFEYIAIDASNNYGWDKVTFEERVSFIYDHIRAGTLDELPLDPKAEKKTLPLLKKSLMVINRARRGIPSGHTVGMDATCSG